jgi:hypothetical protein
MARASTDNGINGAKRELLAEKESDIWLEAKDRLQISLSATNDDRNLMKEDLLFGEGEGHWDDDVVVTTATKETPQLTINLSDALVGRVVNNIKEQRPRGKAHPVGDGADVDRAKFINGIGRHVEYRSQASVAYDTAADCAVRAGVGYARLVAEYISPDSFKKDLRILPIDNIFSVYDDPAAVMPTGCDRNWLLISIKIPRTEYKRLHPNADNVSWNDIGKDDGRQDWEDKETIRLAEYFRIREKSDVLYLLRSADGKEYTKYKSDLKDFKNPGGQILDERESYKREVQWFQLNGVKVTEREILPGTLIPVARCAGNARNIDGRVYRRGMIRAMKDPQRMVDYGETAKILRLGLSTKSKYIAAEGQIEGHPEWTTSNIEPIPTMIYKPVTVETAQGEVLLPPPQAIPPAQVEAGFTEFVQGMRSNLLAVSGMPNEPGQDAQGQVVSGKAIQRRDKLSDQSHIQYYDNQTLMIADLWRIMLEYIPVTYHEPGRIQRIIGDDGKPTMETLNMLGPEGIKNDVTTGDYDVMMDTGPGYDTKREEGADNLLQLLSIQALAEIIAKTAPDLVFRSIDHPYMEEIADRLSAQTPEGLQQIMKELPERARNIIQALSQQNQQLQQALQAAQTGLTKAHLDATVKAHGIEQDNATKRQDVQSRDQTALAIAAMKVHGTLADTEIKTAGKLMDTHAKAGHEAAAAERMIESGETAEKGNGSAGSS